jgi:hypothetical protein
MNPLTGEPAFSKTLPGSSEDHVRWMADTQHLSSNSVPGFDAVPGRELRCGPSLFGQSAELRVERFEITSVNGS